MLAWLAAKWLFAKPLLGSGLGAVWRWLSSLTLWQLVSIGLAGLCILLWFQRNDARHDAVNYSRQRDYYHGELTRITSKRDEQTKVSERTVEKVVKGDPVVQKIVQVIHDAPNPPDCKTPGLSTLRGVL